MLLGMEVGLSPGDFVRWGLLGTQSPFPKGGRAPQFLAHVYCGQTARWIKIALSMEAGLGPGHIVLDGDPAPLPKKGFCLPNFWHIFIVAKRLDASRCHLVWRYASARRHCVRCGPSYPQKKGHSHPTNFWPMSLVAKRLDG